MLKILKIGKSIYLIDDEDKSYRIIRRNPFWNMLTTKQNERNKRLIAGYTRLFTNDKTKKFKNA